MSGRIKAGEGTLIGDAGEHAVMSQLLRRGVVAALAPRNAPMFDILASRGHANVRVRVKTKSAKYSDWQWVVKKDGDTIFRGIGEIGDFVVLVSLSDESGRDEFYVVPTPIVNDWLRRDFEEWLRTPGRGGRPHSPDSKKRHLVYPHYMETLKPFRENWEGLFETLAEIAE